MKMEQYIAHLTIAYKQANLADGEHKERWQDAADANKHCTAIQKILIPMLYGKEYDAWVLYVSGGGTTTPFMEDVDNIITSIQNATPGE